MTILRKFATTTTALGLALSPVLAAAPAFGQEAAPVEGGAETGAAYSEDQIQAFVVAALDVAELRESYQIQLEATTDAVAQQEIVAKANDEILNIVEEAEGITAEEYIEIGNSAAADPELNARIVALMQEKAAMPGE